MNVTCMQLQEEPQEWLDHSSCCKFHSKEQGHHVCWLHLATFTSKLLKSKKFVDGAQQCGILQEDCWKSVEMASCHKNGLKWRWNQDMKSRLWTNSWLWHATKTEWFAADSSWWSWEEGVASKQERKLVCIIHKIVAPINHCCQCVKNGAKKPQTCSQIKREKSQSKKLKQWFFTIIKLLCFLLLFPWLSHVVLHHLAI